MDNALKIQKYGKEIIEISERVSKLYLDSKKLNKRLFRVNVFSIQNKVLVHLEFLNLVSEVENKKKELSNIILLEQEKSFQTEQDIIQSKFDISIFTQLKTNFIDLRESLDYIEQNELNKVKVSNRKVA